MSEIIYETIKDSDGVDCYIKRGEVVRCKDCKWHESDGGALMVCALTELVADDNDYCSWGERR